MIKLIFHGFTALGTVAVAVAAIWGDWFRSKLAPLKLTLILHTPDGDLTIYASGQRAMFYHLKVINERPWISAQNCRVMLVGLSKRDPAGIFQPVPLAVPGQFTWAPAEFMFPIITIVREQVLDLGYIEENGQAFIPRLYATPFNLQCIGPGEAMRFHLQIEAINFVSSIYVIEVAWDGQWSDVPATMKTHLPVRLIPSPAT